MSWNDNAVDGLILFLVKHGYDEHRRFRDFGVWTWTSRSNGVLVKILHYDNCDPCLIADNEKAFNKDSHCPLVCKLPETDEQRDRLLEHLKFLGTPEAEKWSAEFGFMDDNKGMPQSIEETP